MFSQRVGDAEVRKGVKKRSVLNDEVSGEKAADFYLGHYEREITNYGPQVFCGSFFPPHRQRTNLSNSVFEVGRRKANATRINAQHSLCRMSLDGEPQKKARTKKKVS